MDTRRRKETPLRFPLFLDLSQERIVFVGGGKVALRRVLAMLDFAGSISVTAPEPVPELEALAADGRIGLKRRGFLPEDLEGAALVITATGVSEVDGQVWELCKERRIPVNVSGDHTKSDFFFPGLARKGDVVVGVTAGGSDHKKARKLTEAIRALLLGPES